jgi:hypothetical protein
VALQWAVTAWLFLGGAILGLTSPAFVTVGICTSVAQFAAPVRGPRSAANASRFGDDRDGGAYWPSLA